MSQLPRYESYKETGIQWLGKIPNHWKATRIKFIGDIVLGLTYSPEEVTSEGNGVLVLRSSNVQNGVLTLNDNVYVDKLIPKKMVTTAEDILICSRNGSRALIGKCALIEGNGIEQTFGAFMTVLRSPYRKYLYYILSSDLFKFQIGSFLTSTINQLTTHVLGNFKIPFPSVEEQKTITDFLDKRLAQVDALIAKQETLLEKLAEQRIALISHAVTKGLNPDVKLKESGVEWLGKIPSNWEVWKITHAMDLIGSGTTPKSDNLEYYDGDVLWVTTSELRESYIDDTKQKITELAIEDYNALKKYPVNSVAIAMYGATIGRLGILAKEATFNQACCIFTGSKVLYYKFLYYWLWMRRPILISLSNGGGQPNLSQDDLKKLKLALPSISEQKTITDYLDTEVEKYQQIGQRYQLTIEKLKEYRSTLITQVVTGKIDVRQLSVS